jgi:hypothetical protein
MTQWMDKRDATLDDDESWQPAPAEHERTQKVFWGVFALSLFLGVNEYRRSVDFEANAIETKAIVLGKWEDQGENGGTTLKHVRVQFVARDGSEYRYSEGTYNQAAWAKMSVGDQIPVWYEPDDPANHALFERRR